jgi:hypothetical protein
MKAFASAAAALLLASAAALPVQAQTASPTAADAMFRATTLSLAAYGEVKAAPDMATISLGVQTEARTAAAAMQQNAQRMSQVVAALRQAGIAERHIQTSGLNLGAQYAYQDNQPPRLTGYQASNIVTIEVHDLAKLGQTIDAVVGVGANQVHGINFGLRDRTAAENQARLQAVKALAARAELYAGATGHRVSRLVSLSEGTSYAAPPPMPMAMAREAFADKASTPVSPGELTVRIDVNGLYELTR